MVVSDISSPTYSIFSSLLSLANITRLVTLNPAITTGERIVVVIKTYLVKMLSRTAQIIKRRRDEKRPMMKVHQ